MENLTKWLNANKIILNIANYHENNSYIIFNILDIKTALVMCKPMREKLEYEFESHFNGEKLFPTNSVKYLNIKNDKYLD